MPVVAPTGTVAVMEVAETTLNVVAAMVLNFTAVAPVRFVPVIVTTVPTGPVAGVKVVMAGAGITVIVKTAVLIAVPSGVVMLILPVAAPEGTVAEIAVCDVTANEADTVPNLTDVVPVK